MNQLLAQHFFDAFSEVLVSHQEASL